jgi:hypothetical protein
MRSATTVLRATANNSSKGALHSQPVEALWKQFARETQRQAPFQYNPQM